MPKQGRILQALCKILLASEPYNCKYLYGNKYNVHLMTLVKHYIHLISNLKKSSLVIRIQKNCSASWYKSEQFDTKLRYFIFKIMGNVDDLLTSKKFSPPPFCPYIFLVNLDT